MSRLLFLMICLCLLGSISLFAQEDLSPAEKQRRQDNIEAANPFKQFGYKAKIATLSKGKYLEVHDLDSIVTIGSIRFDVEKMKIVGIVVADSTDREFTRPIGDMASRWLSPDPLSEEFPEWSPYTYAVNNPILFIDPDGRYPFPIHIRSFAPFKTFGGGFGGDGANRGFTTSLNATSRLAQSFTMDVTNRTYSNLQTYSSPSTHSVLGSKTANDDKGSISNFTYRQNGDGSTTVYFSASMAGHNPLVPGSPDIDVKTSFTMTENEKAGTLSISAVQSGDAFPAAETFISDTSGNPLFIGVSPAIGNPYTSLAGDGNKKMMSAYFTVTMDDKGVFTGVKQGNNTYTIEDWNKFFQSQPTIKE